MYDACLRKSATQINHFILVDPVRIGLPVLTLSLYIYTHSYIYQVPPLHHSGSFHNTAIQSEMVSTMWLHQCQEAKILNV